MPQSGCPRTPSKPVLTGYNVGDRRQNRDGGRLNTPRGIDMRNVHTTVLTLLVVTAVPSVGVAQVLTLEPSGGRRQSLDHAVPVATVSLVGDIVSLDGGRIVQDSYGEPFVLGTAKLDLSDRSQTKVVFTMANATETPIPLEDVVVYGRTITSATYVRAAVGAPYTPTSAAGMRAAWLGSGEVLQPGASLPVEWTISPTP